MAELNHKADESNNQTFLELFNIKVILMKLKKTEGVSLLPLCIMKIIIARFSATAGLKGKMIAHRLDDLYESNEDYDGKEHQREIHAFITVS